MSKSKSLALISLSLAFVVGCKDSKSDNVADASPDSSHATLDGGVDMTITTQSDGAVADGDTADASPSTPDLGPDAPSTPPGPIDDLVGLWKLSSMSIGGEEPHTFTTETTPQLVGDVLITSTGGSAGDLGSLDVRYVLQMDHIFLGNELTNDVLGMKIYGTDHVVTLDYGDGINVAYTYAIDGAHMEWTYNSSHTSNSGEMVGPTAVEFDRTTAPTRNLSGSWELVQAVVPGEGEDTLTIPNDTCVAIGGGYVKINLTMAVSDRLLGVQTMQMRGFSDDTCTALRGEENKTSRHLFFLNGDSLEDYFYEELSEPGEITAKWTSHTISDPTTDHILLTRTGCASADSGDNCENNEPLTLELRRIAE